MEVHKIVIQVIDFDRLGKDDLVSILENTRFPNDCINLAVREVKTAEVEWSDEHPLNKRDTAAEEFARLFNQ